MQIDDPASDLHPTRVALITAGERLFAERGLHGVSLREIGAAAGQRNNNVTQYHFGSKEGLVLAIFEFRSAAVNAERLRRLGEAEASGPLEVHALLEAFLVPLVEQMAAGNAYVRFLARLRTDGNNQILMNSRRPDVSSAFRRIADVLHRGELAHLPSKHFWSRFRLTVDMGISALANFEPDLLALDEFVAELVDGLTAFLLVSTRDHPSSRGDG